MSRIHRALARFCHNRPARLIDTAGEPYLFRVFLFQWRGWCCYLHHFVSDDAERWLHDHPFNGVSLVLRGSYHEELLVEHDWPRITTATRKIRWFNWIPGDRFHRILKALPDTWTLFIHGPKYKGWGFLERFDFGVSYINPFGNVGDRPWWEDAPTYGQLIECTAAARRRVDDAIRQTIDAARQEGCRDEF